MKKTSFIFLFIFIFLACKRKDEIPKDVLTLNRMKLLMYDLMLAESLQEIKPDIYPPGHHALRDQVLKSHGLSKVNFQKSLDYYQQHPQLYKQLADSLAVYSSAQSVDVMQQPVKSKLNGHHITDSTGPLRDFKRDR